MSLLLDGLRVLRQDTSSVLAFSASMLWGSVVVLGVLRRCLFDHCDRSEYLSLALGGWIVPAVPLAIIVFAAAVLGPPHLGVSVATALLILSASAAAWLAWQTRKGSVAGSLAPVLILAAIFFGSAWLRLAFVANLSLPLYFDSPEHYRIIQTLIQHEVGISDREAVAPVVASYYHLGFHFLLALVASLAHLGVGGLMLVSGQIVLAAVPVSLFLVLRRETGSTVAGLVGVVLGAVGWYMPSYALNWGKYPALFSLGVTLFTINTAYLSGSVHWAPREARRLRVLAFVGGCVAVTIHTRSLVVLALAFLAWAIATWWQPLSGSRRLLPLAAAILALAAEILLVSSSAVLSPALDPYLGGGAWITGMVALLSVPAFRAYPRLAMTALITAVFLLAGLLIPGPVPAFGTLLDRPLVEMIMFIPLSVLGGAGLVALAHALAPRTDLLRRLGAVVVSLLVLSHALSTYSFYPSACCSLVDKDDEAALAWIAANLPKTAQVLVPSAAVSFFPAPYTPEYTETDGGAWILPLTGRTVSELPYWSDFRASSTLDLICQRGVTDIYAGSRETSFSNGSLSERPEWYGAILVLPGARVYHVIGCAAR